MHIGKAIATFFASIFHVTLGVLPYGIALWIDYPIALAAVLDLRLKKAVPAIFLGVCIAAAIMTAVTFGVIHIL